MSETIARRRARIIANNVSIQIDELLKANNVKLELGSDCIFVSVVRVVDSDSSIEETCEIQEVN